MKQSKMTKRLLAVMMSFLMAFSSVQGYIKAEDTEEITNQETSNQIIDEVDSEFTVDTENEIADEVDEKDDADLDTETSDEATKSDIVEDATDSDTTENATDSDVNQATGGDAVEEATPSDADQVIIPETDFEWEDIEGAQINGTMGMRFFYRNAALSLAEAGKDVSGEIEVVSSNATIDGKKITSGAEFSIDTGSKFAFDFEWCADQDETFNAGDFMKIEIGTIKGLNYGTGTAPVDLYISGVKVGSYYLAYKAKTGELAFHINFSDNIGYFQNIAGYFKGSAKFNSITEETLKPINFMGSTTGEITRKPAKPVNPIKPDAGTDTWKPSLPNYDFNYNEKASIIKGRKKAGPVVNEVHYMVGFFDLVKRYEAGEPGAKYDYKYVIIEDELDENQIYNLNRYDGAPFYVEVPLFYYGTNSAVEYGGTTNNSVVINPGNNDKQAGETYSAISSAIFTHITAETSEEIELKVKNTPKSWGIVTTKIGTQKLIVNVGKLGSTDKNEAITMSDISKTYNSYRVLKHNDLINKVKARKNEAEEAIKEYTNETNSPRVFLEEKIKAFKTLYENHKDLAAVEKYIEAIYEYMDDESILEKPVLNKVKETVENEDKAVTDNVQIIDEDVYADLNACLNNYRSDTIKYNENKASYIAAWNQRLEVLNNTLKYYDPGLYGKEFPIYGIILRYSSTITNLSQKIVGNKVNISTGAIEFSESISFQHEFTAGIKGNYTNGDVVLVKADSRYGYKEEDLATLDTKTFKGMEGVKFQVFKEGSTTPIKFMDSTLNANKHYVYIAGNHDNDSNFTDVLVTDSKGTIALSSLPTNGNYYFKEVGAVDGYYGNQNQKIEFQVDKKQITYKLAENVSRSVTLKKVDAETKSGLEGVTFAIYDKNTNTELTGFTKDGDVYLYDKKGNAELKTNKEGILEVRNLPAGEFYMKETKALEDYMPLEGKANYFPFTLSEDLPTDGGAIIKINNGENILNFKLELPEFKASLKVIKKGDDDKLLDGVEFELYTASDDELVGTYVTDVNGEITINDLTIGTYYLIETKGKDGYEFDSTKKYDVVINGENTSIEKEIINNKKVIPPTPIVPDVTPDRPVNPDKPEVNIPDEDVPLGPGEEVVEIEEEDVPLSDGGDNAFVEIEEEDVPLGSGVPNTGDGLYFWIPAMLISMTALGFLNVLRRKLSK